MTVRSTILSLLAGLALVLGVTGAPLAQVTAPGTTQVTMESFALPPGARPHDVAPGPGGVVWYTAQGQGALGRLDPGTGEVRQIPLAIKRLAPPAKERALGLF